MQPQHTSPEEAVQIALDTGTTVALGIHWGTFPLADEPYAEPAERFSKGLHDQEHSGLSGKPLIPGDCWQLHAEPISSKAATLDTDETGSAPPPEDCSVM